MVPVPPIRGSYTHSFIEAKIGKASRWLDTYITAVFSLAFDVGMWIIHKLCCSHRLYPNYATCHALNFAWGEHCHVQPPTLLKCRGVVTDFTLKPLLHVHVCVYHYCLC